MPVSMPKSQAARCVNCGAYLDPGERCDCEQREAVALVQKRRKARVSFAERAERESQKAWLEFYYR